ncbi:hypothetical protein AK812_SmicGene24509 [Symbiodinium microadriaticum]|uniref:Uncharacterized protein n=1 Tax=Symbiodinium microadriaticum TaxID=2951 RepID=A0A1Q9DEJ5_SYMMI|nr:hypothetical protein AK812_SmicGene24509 [Symbiodinium microadriaticum]
MCMIKQSKMQRMGGFLLEDGSQEDGSHEEYDSDGNYKESSNDYDNEGSYEDGSNTGHEYGNEGNDEDSLFEDLDALLANSRSSGLEDQKLCLVAVSARRSKAGDNTTGTTIDRDDGDNQGGGGGGGGGGGDDQGDDHDHDKGELPEIAGKEHQGCQCYSPLESRCLFLQKLKPSLQKVWTVFVIVCLVPFILPVLLLAQMSIAVEACHLAVNRDEILIEASRQDLGPGWSSALCGMFKLPGDMMLQGSGKASRVALRVQSEVQAGRFASTMCCGEIEQLTDLVTRRAVTYIGLAEDGRSRVELELMPRTEAQLLELHPHEICDAAGRNYTSVCDQAWGFECGFACTEMNAENPPLHDFEHMLSTMNLSTASADELELACMDVTTALLGKTQDDHAGHVVNDRARRTSAKALSAKYWRVSGAGDYPVMLCQTRLQP